MFRFSSKMLKTNAWSGRDPKIHLDETRVLAKRGWVQLTQQFQILNEQYQIKGAPLRDWIDQYGVGPLLHSKDAAVRRAMNHVRKALQDSVRSTEEGGTLRMNELAAFREEYGTNVTDWLFKLTDPNRKTSSFDTPDSGSDGGDYGGYYDNDAEDDADPDSLYREVNNANDSKLAFFGGREPADLKYEPVEFEDVEVTIYDKDGDPVRTHSVSGSAKRDMSNRIDIDLLPESIEDISDEEWDASEIEFQISRLIQDEVPTWDEATRLSRSL